MHATKQGDPRRQADGACRLTDLITVIAVVLMLGAVQWPSLANTKGKGQLAICLDNHRQLARAWNSYAQDNDGRLVGNLDGADVLNPSNSKRTWVLGWLDFSGSPDNTNTHFLTQMSPLALYLGRTAAVFKCPADRSLRFGTRGAPRVRSLSMNSYMGDGREPYISAYKQFKKISEIVDPKPSQALVFIDERDDSINDGVLFIDMRGYDPTTPSLYRIVDYPADWHNHGANLSFADGHGETWRWEDDRTMPKHSGALVPLNVASPDNPDVARIQAAASRKSVQIN